MRHSPHRQRGMTLIELVMTLVILGIVLVALYAAQASIISRSVDPLLQQQGLYLAEGVLEALQAMSEGDAKTHADQYINARTLLNPIDDQPMAILQNYLIKVERNEISMDSVDLTSFTVTVSNDGQDIRLTGYRHYGEGE
ncbi:prepilin-type N-terminal cleavage/methylation domain-containing protein [Pseudomonas sp. ABC1]|uniref:type IV pilus modification PilV family protein n=1 Tax=Pseudomonas sp. ABC1 TaxID=2748080 RepID=UPI0015C3DDF8|nr:prepilin-type N-terminal cleavage/methylation domain-containing protein [Pseudomonas sp. ABC1]QLF92448.1 prepilin-type N-terminal cleavage/methylation domain-containing protein [Pseudomonas sp. ABC1]